LGWGDIFRFADAREGMEIVMLDAAPETMAKKISESAKVVLAGLLKYTVTTVP